MNPIQRKFLPAVCAAALALGMVGIAQAGTPVNVVPIPPKDTTNTKPTAPSEFPPGTHIDTVPTTSVRGKTRIRSVPVTHSRIYGEKVKPGVQPVRVYRYGGKHRSTRSMTTYHHRRRRHHRTAS